MKSYTNIQFTDLVLDMTVKVTVSTLDEAHPVRTCEGRVVRLCPDMFGLEVMEEDCSYIIDKDDIVLLEKVEDKPQG